MELATKKVLVITRTSFQSSTVQGFSVHFLCNYPMDYYGNDQLILKQQKELEARIQENLVISGDKFQ